MRELPRALSSLPELAFDLRWSIGPAADAVWRSVERRIGAPFVRVTPAHPAARVTLELPLAARSVP
jgi:hypothetical protein